MNKIFKRITASVISLMTILTMLPISGITAVLALTLNRYWFDVH